MKSKKKKEERKKETRRKNLGPLHSHETRRGRGRSCLVKADKKFASRAKRKRKKEKERINAPTGVNRLYHGRLK